MRITRQVDCHGLVNTDISGHVEMSDILKAVLELGRLSERSNQFWEIIILDPQIIIDRSMHATLEVAHRAKEAIQFKSTGAVAIVATTPQAFDWSEQIARLLRGDTVPVTVFESESPARKWLSIRMEQARRDATTVRSRAN